MVNPKSETLLGELKQKPEDLGLREKAARALQREGRHVEAVQLLTGSLRNLTAHEPPPLPCLCRKCLDPERTSAELFGLSYDREFAVAKGRVLFYWVPRELAHRRDGVVQAVQSRLEDKLSDKKKR
jgi:hypothetical protein